MERQLYLIFVSLFMILALLRICRDVTKEKDKNDPGHLREHILIVTYVEETGGTLVGDILQLHPRVFYMHEPLRALRLATTGGDSIKYLDGSEWNPESFRDVALDTIGRLTTCDLDHIGTVLWKDEFIDKSNDGKLFNLCLKQMKLNSTFTSSMETCLTVLRAICMDKKWVLVSKVARVALRDLRPLMVKYPSLKIVYVFQDPMEILKSQMKVGIIEKYNVKRKAFQFCREVFNDILFFVYSYKVKYPGRVLKIHWTDFINNPVNASRELYSFSGLEFTSDIKDVISNFGIYGTFDLHSGKETKRTNKNSEMNNQMSNKNDDENNKFIKSAQKVCGFWIDKIDIILSKR